MNRILRDKNSALCIVDLQERFMPHIDQAEAIVRQTQILIQAAKILDVPIILTEQYPKGLGRTIPAIKDLLPALEPLEKTAFGCFGSDVFREKVCWLGRENLILCGIETHVCIMQTALAALDNNFHIVVAADAVSSRSPANRQLALDRMRSAGVEIVSTEMVVMEWLYDASNPNFKAVQALIK